MDYKKNYLKYKLKYLNAKKTLGGSIITTQHPSSLELNTAAKNGDLDAFEKLIQKQNEWINSLIKKEHIAWTRPLMTARIVAKQNNNSKIEALISKTLST